MKVKRSENYKKFKFNIHHYTLEYSQFSIGFLWIGHNNLIFFFKKKNKKSVQDFNIGYKYF